MNNIRGAKIIYQESKATQPSYLYFLQKDANNFDIIVTSESGVKRRLNSSVDLSNYYKKSETYSKDEVDDIISDISVVDVSNLVPYTGADKNLNIGANYFESSQGFKKTGGTANQSLTANGGVFDLTTKLDKGTYTGTAESLKNEIDSKQKLLSSFDESILIENNGNIEVNVSLFEESFEQQECELNFEPIQIVAVYQDGIKLSRSEYEIILPKKIKIKEYVDENIQVQYTHLKS